MEPLDSQTGNDVAMGFAVSSLPADLKETDIKGSS